MNVGETIKALRLAQDMEISDLSIKAKVPATTIRGWEDGVTPMCGPPLMSVAEALGVSMTVLTAAAVSGEEDG